MIVCILKSGNVQIVYYNDKKQEGERKGDMERIIAEWIPYMMAYRLYDPKHPQQTIAYEDDKDTEKQHATENGYEVTFLW